MLLFIALNDCGFSRRSFLANFSATISCSFFSSSLSPSSLLFNSPVEDDTADNSSLNCSDENDDDGPLGVIVGAAPMPEPLCPLLAMPVDVVDLPAAAVVVVVRDIVVEVVTLVMLELE